MKRIGILALQGAFIEHRPILSRLGVEAFEVRLAEQLQGLDGLILPGGESTTMGKLAVAYNLRQEIHRLAGEGLSIWGICAGAILMAKELSESYEQPLLGLMDIRIRRNAFGRQVDSFEEDIAVPRLDLVSTPEEKGRPFHAIFIRAPYLERVGEGIQILARLGKGPIIAAQEGNLLALAFHPELTQDTRFHRYFLRMVEDARFR